MLAFLRSVAPELERPERLIAVDRVDPVRLAVQEQQTGADVEEGQTGHAHPLPPMLDRLGHAAAAQEGVDVLEAGRRIEVPHSLQFGRRQQELGPVEEELPLMGGPLGEPPLGLLGGGKRRQQESRQDQHADGAHTVCRERHHAMR